MDSLLPANATQLERDIETVIAARYDGIGVNLRDLNNADDCPLEFLPWLAWARSVDVWDADWPEHVKREAVKTSLSIHEKKGTSAAVREAVAAMGGSSVLTEWWETSPQGTPNTFQVLLNYAGQEVTADLQNNIIEAIDRTKRLSQEYTVQTGISGSAKINMLGYVRMATFQRFTFEDAPE